MFSYLTSHWIEVLQGFVVNDQPVVMITVANVEGSAPRESSCRMFVLENQVIETIGGGNLEFEAISLARKMLNNERGDDYRLEIYGLGPAFQQCCGGVVTLAFEKIVSMPDWLCKLDYSGNRDSVLVSEFSESQIARYISEKQMNETDHLGDAVLIEKLNPLRPDVVVFGAGHVGHALIEKLARLPFEISWVDERNELFPTTLASNVRIYTNNPLLQHIDQLPDQALNIIMTHSHELDEDICFKYLKEKEFYFLGLIGSKTKRARFLHRLRDRGIVQEQLSQLTCPIGVVDVAGSSPPEIAIAVAAQLLSLRDQMKLDTSLT